MPFRILFTALLIALSFAGMAQNDPVKEQDPTDTLNSVYFYLDAAIIQPKSKDLLDSVYNVMVADPNVHVTIHGHSNGKNIGPIVTKGNAEEIFALNIYSNKWRIGTAFTLSRFRAEIVEEYLVKRGIDEERIETVGWGGAYMLYKNHVEKSWYNARSDIEFYYPEY